MSNGVKRSKTSYDSDSDGETASKNRRHESDSENSESRRKKFSKKSKKKLSKSNVSSSGSESDRSRSNKSNQSDVEDGEVASSGNTSSSDSSVFNDGYDSDLIGDEEDRRRLDAMTEKEREEEIYRRTEQRDFLLRRFETKKKIKQQQREAKRAEKKRSKKTHKKTVKMAKEDGEESEETGLNLSDVSMSERRKTNESKRKETEVSKALANLKADREKKKQQAENHRKKAEKIQQQKKLRTEDVFSSSSNDEEDNDSRSESEQSDSTDSDSSSDGDKRASKQSKVPITNKEDLNSIKLSRHKAEKWCHTPFFKKVAIGCYVRIGIGNNKGMPVYQIAEVVDVIESQKVYQLGTTRTNKGLKLRHGTDERDYRLEFISNQPFTEDEFNRWKSTMEKKSLRFPTLSDVDTKSKEIQSFVEYSLKEEDLDFIQQEKKKFAKNDDKIVEKKLELLKKRQEARQSNDMLLVEEIDQQIQELNEKADFLSAKRSGNFLMLSQINQRNRQRTSVAVEEAMKKEFERQKELKDDPFQRRKELPSLIHIKKKPVQDKVEPSKDEIKKDEELSAKVETEAKTNVDNEKRKSSENNKGNDLFQAHNFDITIDISGSAFPTSQIQQSSFSLPSSNLASSGSAITRRALNLDDYKRKKGLI